MIRDGDELRPHRGEAEGTIETIEVVTIEVDEVVMTEGMTEAGTTREEMIEVVMIGETIEAAGLTEVETVHRGMKTEEMIGEMIDEVVMMIEGVVMTIEGVVTIGGRLSTGEAGIR